MSKLVDHGESGQTGKVGNGLKSSAFLFVLIIICGILSSYFFYSFYSRGEEAYAGADQEKTAGTVLLQGSASNPPSINSAPPVPIIFDPTGVWLGHVALGNQSAKIAFKFWLENNRLLGLAKFPIGEGNIDGTISGSQLNFKGMHSHNGIPVQTTYSATMTNANEMAINLNSQGALMTLTVSRYTVGAGRIPW